MDRINRQSASRACVEKALSCHHDRKYCCLVGNATTAITLGLKALGIQRGKVAIPNSVCPNVGLAVYFSGNQPVYIDIDEDNLGLSVTGIQRCTEELDAVLAVHAYGSVCDIDGLVQYCERKGIPLIEDACVAIGAKHAGQPVGSNGSFSVVSFGAGKIIDAGHGGAFLTDDDSLFYAFQNLETSLPEFDSNGMGIIEKVSKYHTNLYNDHYGIDHWRYADDFKAFALSSESATLHRYSDAFSGRILDGMEGLEDNLVARQEKVTYARELFSADGLHGLILHQPAKGSVFWRMNIFVPEGRDLLLKTILSRGLPVSSWFPSLDLFMEGPRGESSDMSVSDLVGNRILNIWVNDQVDELYYLTIAEIMRTVHKEL